MALEYHFSLQTDLTPEQLCAVLKLFEDGWLWITCLESSDLARSLILEAFGFRPDVDVVFRFGGGSYEPYLSLVRAMNDVLLREHGDAVLLFNGETPVLRRRRGNLQLNSSYKWLNEELRPLFTHEYQTEDMARL